MDSTCTLKGWDGVIDELRPIWCSEMKEQSEKRLAGNEEGGSAKKCKTDLAVIWIGWFGDWCVIGSETFCGLIQVLNQMWVAWQFEQVLMAL